MPASRTWRDILILTALCGIVYFFLPTTHGLTNWQEAKRALVAREMDKRLDSDPWAWLVPTDDGKPYLAKPPMIYWCQLAVARVLGRESDELCLRLTVALAGWLGVLATYLASRQIVRLGIPREPAPGNQDFADSLPLWAALLLATGPLYVRSSRFGELDILLVPTVVSAIGLIVRAWRHTNETGRPHFPALAGAIIITSAAVLTKGPPAVLTLALAAYGGMLLWAAFRTDFPAAPARSRIIAACIGLAAFAVPAFRSFGEAGDAIGVAVLAFLGACVGWVLGALATRLRLANLWHLWSRTHPVAVLGVPLLVFFGWGRAVAARIGDTVVGASAAEEIEDNLRLFVPEAPLNNAEAMLYGVGLGSVLFVLALAHLLWRRPRLAPGLAVCLAWVGLGFIAFSTLGKGVPRYLTPLWPGIAILGAWWLCLCVPDARAVTKLNRAAAVIVTVLALAQAWWYGVGLERFYPGRSPRAFVAELRSLTNPDDVISTFEFSTPALDYYLGSHVESFHDVVPRHNLHMVGPRTIAELKQELAGGKRYIILARAVQPSSQDSKPALDCLLDAGLEVEPIEVSAPFIIDNGRTKVRALRLRDGTAK